MGTALPGGATAMRAALVLLMCGTAAAQPPGGGGYFGAPPGQAFTPDQAFAAPAPPAATAVLTGEAPPPPPWSGSADLGLNGATGNAELFNLRTGFIVQRRTADNLLNTDFLYTYAQADGRTTVQQALFNARDEILFPGRPWSAFGSTQVEYDELRAYQFRVGVYGGVAYAVVDTAVTALKLRAGAGAILELGTGGLADRWVPELVFGKDFRWKLSDADSFVSTVDYFPRADDFTQFRVRARAAYEHVLSQANGMILRLGVQDRYDSNPGNARRNDLTYFATVGVKF
jgi:hypothetical protein